MEGFEPKSSKKEKEDSNSRSINKKLRIREQLLQKD